MVRMSFDFVVEKAIGNLLFDTIYIWVLYKVIFGNKTFLLKIMNEWSIRLKPKEVTMSKLFFNYSLHTRA